MSESEPNPQAVPESTPAEGATESAEAAASSETASAQATTSAVPAPDAPPAPAATGGQGGAVPPAPGQFAPAPPAPGVPVGMSAPAVASAPGVPAMAPGAMAAQPGMAPQGAPRPVNPRTAARNAYITQCFRVPGIITWVAGLVITLVVAFIVGAIANSVLTDLAGGFMSRDDAPSLLGPLAGMALGGKAELTASYSSMRAGGATLRILPSIGHLVIFIAIALLAKFRRAGEIIPVDIAAVAARAGIEAFGVAVVSMVVFLIASVDIGGAHIAADPFAVFFNTLVLVFLALVVGRFATYKHLLVTGRSSIAYQGIFDAVVIFVVSIAVCFLFGAVVLMLKDAKPALALAMPLNLGVIGAGLAALGYIDRGLNGSGKWGGSSHGLGDMSAFDGGAISLMLVALVVMFILATVAVAVLRRPNYGPVRWLYIAYAAPTALVLWGYSIYAYARFSLGMDVFGYDGKGGIGLAPVSVVNLVIYTALVSLAAEFAPRCLRNLRFRPVLVPVAGAAAMAAGTTPAVAGVPGAVPAVPGAVPVAGSAPVVTGSMPAVAPSAATGSVPVTNPAAVAMPTANVASDQQLPLTGSAGAASGATAYSAPGVASAPASGQMNPYTTTYPSAPRKPLSKKAKVSLASVLAVVLVVIIGVVGVNVINSGRTAEETVRNYAQLIADGKYDEANKVVDPGVENNRRILLTDKAHDGVKNAVKVESVTQKETGEKSKLSYVEVVLRINGKRSSYYVSVKQGDNEYGLLKTWKIMSPLLTNAVNFPARSEVKGYKIGSVALTVPAPQDGAAPMFFPMYPGVYNVEVQGSNSEYVKTSLSKNQIEVASDGSSGDGKYLSQSDSGLEVKVEPTDKLKSWALDQVRDKVKSCASTSGTNMDSDCPYVVQSRDLDVLEVKSLPTSLDTFKYSDYDHRILVQGTGTITYKYKDSTYVTWDRRDVDYLVTGYITFDEKGQPQIEWANY